MSRLRADALLLLVAVIWGFAFIAQKAGMQSLGPFGFGGGRFLLSFLVVLPFAMREVRKVIDRRALVLCVPLCIAFFGGVILQQLGLQTTSVTNAGFLTGLYVIFTPLLALVFYRKAPGPTVWVACAMACAGTFLLSGGRLDAFVAGDWLIMASAICFAVQIMLLGYLVQRTGRPLFLACVQYAFCAIVGLSVAAFTEPLNFAAIADSWLPLLYGGVISGGIAYTLQGVAQQYAPPSDAAIIMSAEALFAALAAAVILHERLTPMAWAGCGLLFSAVLVVEAAAYLVAKRNPFR